MSVSPLCFLCGICIKTAIKKEADGFPVFPWVCIGILIDPLAEYCHVRVYTLPRGRNHVETHFLIHFFYSWITDSTIGPASKYLHVFY